MNERRFKQCPLCGGEYSHLYDLSHTEVVRCLSNDCGLVFAKSQPSVEDLNKLYNTFLYPEGDSTTRSAPKPNSDKSKFLQHFDMLDKKLTLVGKKVLDYGCGIGNFLEIARDGGVAEAMGIELNDRAREWASNKGFRVEKGIDDYESGIFDLVYMNDVIEHLRDPVASLKEIDRLLAPNGTIFVITINVGGLKARLLKEKWDMIVEATHLYYYDRKSLRRTLVEAGYTHIHEERFFVDFSHHNSLQGIAQRVLIKTGMDSSLKILASNFHSEVR